MKIRRFILISAALGLVVGCDSDTTSREDQEMIAGEITAGEMTAGEVAAGETIAGETVAGEMIAGETVAGEMTAGETTAGETTAGETTAGETTAGEMTAGEMIQDDDGPCKESTLGCPELDWVTIEGSSFSMGSTGGSPDEQPVHMVNVSTFQMMRTEITVGMYRLCVDAGVCSEPNTFSDYCHWTAEAEERERYPANCLSWFQLNTFADWVGARLPSEAEWEFAARGGIDANVYPWGVDEPSCDLASYGGCIQGSSEVCSFPMGNTAQGLCDMSGNVWEWVQDEWHLSYDGAPNDGSGWCESAGCSADPSNLTFRVMRGGYWNGEATTVRSSYRMNGDPNINFGFRGGRLAR